MKSLLYITLACIGFAQALNNGQGKVPPMGWNTWHALGCDNLSE